MYKTVKINDKTPVNKHMYKNVVEPGSYWSNKLNGYRYGNEPEQYKMQYVKSNGNVNMSSSNPFLYAFMNAYNNHEDIILSPDDVWIVILLNFTKYVNDHAEELRKVFVDHDGKKKLTVVEPVGKDENDWTDFFSLMKTAIEKNVKGNIVANLPCNFSTTGTVESILSYACIMDTFKQYFEYGRCIPCCGIRQVKFMGTLEDWTNLKKKAQNIAEFLNGNAEKNFISKLLADKSSFTKYIDDLIPILDKFIDTYNGNANTSFWDKVMNLEHGSLGSGSTTYISGWILNFFLGYSGKKVDMGDITLDTIKVEVNVENHCTGLKKVCTVVGGFHGVEYADNASRPVMSIGVFEDTKTVQSLY